MTAASAAVAAAAEFRRRKAEYWGFPRKNRRSFFDPRVAIDAADAVAVAIDVVVAVAAVVAVVEFFSAPFHERPPPLWP